MCFRPPSIEQEDITCPQCGATNVPGAKKCGACGEVLPQIAPPGSQARGASRAPGAAAPPKPGATPSIPKAPGAASLPPTPGKTQVLNVPSSKGDG